MLVRPYGECLYSMQDLIFHTKSFVQGSIISFLLRSTYGVHALVITVLTLALAFSKGATASMYTFEPKLVPQSPPAPLLFLLAQGFLSVYSNILIMKHALDIIYSSHLTACF